MSLQQSTFVSGRMLLHPFSSYTRANLASYSRRKFWNGVNNRRFHKTNYNTSTTGTAQQQWVHAVKLLFGNKMSARESLKKLLELFRKQFNVYAAQRLRRMGQTINLYSALYSEKSLRSLATNFARRYLKGKRRPFYVLFGGACCCISEKDKITESELHNRCSNDLALITELEKLPNLANVAPSRLSSWEVIINKEELRVWKRPIQNTYLFEYKVCGRFTDISAKAFFRVQLDLEYRKVWDKYVLQLDCVDRDDLGSEVIHWITHFPSRDYVFTRRYKVDNKNKTMMLVSRAVDHPMIPATNKHVRVTTYFSQMVIKPHRSFEENGFDFVLTYHDDPQAMFPQFAVNWVTHKGCPDYVSKLHDAARQLEDLTSTQICVPSKQASKVKDVQNTRPGDYSDNRNPQQYTSSSAGHYA